MSEEVECAEGEKAAERFRRMVKKVVSVPKSEIDKRSAKDRAERESKKTKDAEE